MPFGATFLIFSDYMRPAIRLAALSDAHVIYVWTHDSIALGRGRPDAPARRAARQPAGRCPTSWCSGRPTPTRRSRRGGSPCSTAAGPVALVLTRQKLPVLDRTKLAPAAGTARGAYVLIDADAGSRRSSSSSRQARRCRSRSRPTSGSPPRACGAAWCRCRRGSCSRRSPPTTARRCCPPRCRARVSIEAGSPLGWERYVGPAGAILGVDRFGASAPGAEVMARYGFTVDHVVATAKAVLARGPDPRTP